MAMTPKARPAFEFKDGLKTSIAVRLIKNAMRRYLLNLSTAEDSLKISIAVRLIKNTMRRYLLNSSTAEDSLKTSIAVGLIENSGGVLS